MTTRPGLWAPIILSLLVIGTGMPVQVTAQETIRVATPLLPTPAFPQMLASDKGFFQKRGLRAEFIRINSEPTTYQALIAGDVHVTSGAPVGLVLSHAQGIDVVALASWYNIVPYTLATREKISDLSLLKGKKIGINRLGGRSALILQVMLEDAGLDPFKDVMLLQLGGSQERLAALLSGGIDAAPVDFSLEPKMASLGLFLVKTKRTPFLTAPTVVRKSYLQSHRSTLRRFFEGYLEAMQHMIKNKEDSFRTLARVLGTGDRQILEHTYNGLLSDLDPNLIPSQDAVKNLLKMVAYTDKRAASVKAEALFDFSLLEELGIKTARPSQK
jgi:ABC-type nitrate/sulfonate/bicarbonate transport system substrate-binding protein